ncbi:Nn.00g088310.m01.CDS01 [Neocucurbitaria sp. VM-36]
MTTRRPLQPLPPPSTNIINTRYARITTADANGTITMEERIQEDTQDVGSVVSGLSSLENDADDFEKLMIQNARDERRLNEALHGRVQAFRKARTHPRVGLTIDNLERNNARNDAAVGANAHVKLESPPSSSGSTRSDPAIHAPPGWGRKSRSNRNWMRTITYDADEDQPQQTPRPVDETINGHYNDSYHQHADDVHGANVPRRSVEDSPLSHKSSIHGTPRNDRSAEWDLTFELNEASIIASTPYIPRNTALDDIRQREMESLREHAATTVRLDSIREGSPEQIPRPRSSSTKSINHVANGAISTEQATQVAASPQKKLRARTNSWQSIGKSQPVTGVGKENSLTAMYKSAETIGTVEEDVLVDSHKNPPRPTRHRREDSQDLLRRLARVSNTPSPGRVAPRPQTAPARQTNSSAQATVTDEAPTVIERKDEPVVEAPMADDAVEPAASTPELQAPPHGAEAPLEPVPEPEDGDGDATPIPIARSMLNPKTPVVTGAWVDTPGPRTIRKLGVSTSRSHSKPPKKGSPSKGKSPEKSDAPTTKEALEAVAAETLRPQLPSSALQALVQEAKANGKRHSTEYGDSTINSLEDLITSPTDNTEAEVDEDTLQGLQLPTSIPRNEAERQRQQELLHLHRMNDRLRTVRTSIRDASRGMKRVEDRVEHAEDEGANGEKVKVVYSDCPCAASGGHQFSLWRWWKSLFWQERLKTERQARNNRWKSVGGLTGLGIFVVLFFTWWISEEIACEIYCQPMYAQYSPYPFSVYMNAPQYPFVIPTLVYRNFVKAWWLPLSSFVSWIWTIMYNGIIGSEDISTQTVLAEAYRAASSTGKRVWRVSSQNAQPTEELDWDLSMGDDQLVGNHGRY